MFCQFTKGIKRIESFCISFVLLILVIELEASFIDEGNDLACG